MSLGTGCGSLDKSTQAVMFEYQPPKVLNQAAPVQNTWYTIGLADGVMLNARIWQVGVNVEDTNETLEVQALINGETIQALQLPATHSTPYYGAIRPEPITRVDLFVLDAGNAVPHRRAFIVDGHSIEIQVRKITVAGAGNLTGIVMWGQLSRV